MTDIVQSIEGCRIAPLAPRTVTASQVRSSDDWFRLGVVVWVAVNVVGYVALSNIDGKWVWWVWLLPFAASWCVAIWMVRSLRDRDATNNSRIQNETFVEDSLRESDSASREAMNYIATALTEIKHIENNLAIARSQIQQARVEFAENAPSPFWDRIEAAIAQLAEAQSHFKRLPLLSRMYARKLDGRQHNFPPFPLSASMVSDLREVATNLHEVVRLGQRSNIFSMNYEIRRTREAVNAGFKFLNEELYQLGSSFDASMMSLLSELEAILNSGRR